MDKYFIHFVENLCKSMFKSPCKFHAKLCVKNKIFIHPVQISIFPPIFPAFFATFPTTIPPLYLTNLFHFSTQPITTTINKFIERN